MAFTNGCFDVLHPGHLDLLVKAKAMGDLLVVVVNSDASVRGLKGEGRPVLDQDSRLRMVSSFVQVDAVCLFGDEHELAQYVTAFKPNFLVKGGDWRGKKVTGADYVSRHGGRVVFVPHTHSVSTTSLLSGPARAQLDIASP